MEQISLFDFVVQNPDPEPVIKFSSIKAIGEKIGKIVLGECRIATVTSVEGSGREFPPYYRTDRGICYEYKCGLDDVADLLKKAESERKKYKTIEPSNLQECVTIEHVRKVDGRVLWKQIGIFNNMLFWKDWCTYQFLEPYENEKALKKAYEKKKKEMEDDLNSEFYPEARVSEQEHPMRRLYWSNHGFYADAEYVLWNG